MISGILIFLVLTAMIWAAIFGIQKITKRQVLSLTKIAAYAIISATAAMMVIFTGTMDVGSIKISTD